jgi:hypothetical protein
MAKAIPQLTDATTVNAADELIVQQGGVTKRATGAELAKGLNAINNTINVKDFGAVGDGVANDTAAIQAAVTAASGSTVLIPEGTYKCTAAINVSSNTRIVGYGATLDYTSATNYARRVRLDGTVGNGIAITANASANTNSVTVGDASSFAKNDLVFISSDAVFPDTSVKIGELAIVRDISSSTIRFVGPLYNAYSTTDSPIIRKVSPVSNCSIEGITIVGRGASVATVTSTGEVGIGATYCRNLTIKDCNILYTDNHGMRIESCYGTHISGNRIIQEKAGANPSIVGVVLSPIQYGITLIDACACSIVSGNSIWNGKHGIVWSEANQVGACYGDIIAGNYVEGTWAAGISTHASNFYFVVSGNIIKGCTAGINIRVSRGVVSNNNINFGDISYYSTISEQAAIALTQAAERLQISGNHISGYRFGIRANSYFTNRGPSNLNISSNYLENITQRGIYLEKVNSTDPVYGVVIQNNLLRNISGDSVFLDGGFVGAVVQNNVFQDYEQSTTGFGVRLGGTDKTLISSNTFSSLTPVQAQASTHSAPQTTNYTVMANNMFDHTTGLFGGTFTNYIVKGNIKIADSPFVTIDSGVIAVPMGAPFIIVNTEASAATDDLDTINGGMIGDLIILQTISDARDITLKDGTGNLRLAGDFTLNTRDDSIALLWTGSFWMEVSRSNNA